MASLSDILTAVQNAVNALNGFVTATNRVIPPFTSGQLVADTLVQTGFVRVTGVSVYAGGAVGALHDAASLALAVSGTEIYQVGTTEGYFATDMVFKDGLVYKPGAAQIVAIFYSRT